jgi:hypothetical protein
MKVTIVTRAAAVARIRGRSQKKAERLDDADGVINLR